MEDNDIQVSLSPTFLLGVQVNVMLEQYKGKYKLNESNYERLIETCTAMHEVSRPDDGEVSVVVSEPAENLAAVQVKVDDVDLYGDMLRKFIDKMDCFDGFRVTTEQNSVFITFVVKNIWEADA